MRKWSAKQIAIVHLRFNNFNKNKRHGKNNHKIL